MMYLITQRYENGPKGLLRVIPYVPGALKSFRIEKVLINEDSAMHYRQQENSEYFEYAVYSIRFNKEEINYIEFFTKLIKNNHEKVMEFDDDESALLYFEVMKNELA